MHGNEIIYALIFINNNFYHVNLACYQGVIRTSHMSLLGQLMNTVTNSLIGVSFESLGIKLVLSVYTLYLWDECYNIAL